jgi:hydroxymethylpyrimidine/phosphomethylpyrimidine kinase
LLGRVLPARQAARALLQLGARAVLLKGGHARGNEVVDYFADSAGIREIRHSRQPFDARGTGCVLSSAIAAHLSHGLTLRDAVAAGEDFLQRALLHSQPTGRGTARFLLLDPLTNK